MTAEDLKRIVLENDSERSYMTVISSDKVTVEILELIIKKTEDPLILMQILESPLMNSELLDLIVKKENSLDEGSNELKRHILNSSFLTKEIFDGMTKNPDISFLSELINSKYCDKEAFSRIVDVLFNDLSKENLLVIIGNKYFDDSIAGLILDASKLDADVIKEILNSSVLSDENFGRACEAYLNESETDKNVVNSIISDSRCNIDILKKIVDKCDAEVIGSYIKEILENPTVKDELKKQLLEFINNSTVMKLLKEDGIAEEYLMILAERKYRFVSRDSYSYSRTPSVTGKEIGNALIDYSNTTGKVIAGVVNNDTLGYDESKVAEHPKADHNVKAAVICSKSYLYNEDIDKFFSIDGLDADDILRLIDKTSAVSTYKRILEYDKIDDERIYKKILEKIYSSRDLRDERESVLDSLLSRNVSNGILRDIVERETKADLSKQAVFNKVLSHPNVELIVVEKIANFAERFNDTIKEMLLNRCAETKRKIMAKIYDKEEEGDITEILRVNVEEGMSTMLWGPSGVGKSSRVFEVDETATLLILKNGMLPEEVVGGKEPNGNPGEVYPPHWYRVLCQKCEAEPDRQHILFIDEITNVNDTIKNLVWEVVGNRLVNGNEDWPLPENCAIVLAGNRPEESSAVRVDRGGGVMPAPLHNRVDSMLVIDFDVDEWQRWALETDSKTGNLRIHPIVYSFCMANADKCMFTPFDPEDVTQPFLTPRKWEALSKAIYSAEKRGKMHHVSDARVFSILGHTNVANAFIAHYERMPIDMERIVMGTYNEEDFPSIEDKLYALGIVIAEYDGDPIAIEAFIVDCLGDEYLSIYNAMKNVRKGTLENRKSVVDTNTNTDSIGFRGRI